MEFNKPPEGFEGKQKRRTDFESTEEKLAYDAQNLLQLAKDRYGREQVTVRDALDLSSRHDDDIEALRKALAVALKTKPDFEQFINGLNLDDAHKLKLRKMMDPANYAKAVATAEEDMNPGCKIPADIYERVVAELMTWSEEKLRAVCEEAEMPRLLVVTPGSFDEKVAAMDEHKHYTHKDGKPQEDAYVDRDSNSPYRYPPKMKKGKVTISDSIPHPKQLTGVSTKLGERRAHLTQKYAEKGMRHIDKDEMATLVQQSLREAGETGDNSKIVDNWEDGNGTVTFLDPDSLTDSAFVACAFFDSNNHRAGFDYDSPESERDYARGRASMQVLKF